MLHIKYLKGSITVEATLVMPIFIFAVLSFLYFFQIILVQESIQHAMTETGKSLSETAYIYNYLSQDGKEEDDKNVLLEIVDSVLIKKKMGDFLEESLINNSCILGGINGIIMSQSSFLKEENIIDIVAIYRFKMPLPVLSLSDIPIVQRVKVRAFTGHKPSLDEKNGGYEENNGDDKIVYITETGRVYHLTRECSYLKLKIKELKYIGLEAERNESGEKYRSCEQCTKSQLLDNSKTVYITVYGNRYHSDLSCSGLKRSIIEIPLSQINEKALCSKCGN